MSISDTLNRESFGGFSTGQLIGLILSVCIALIIMCVLGSTIVGWVVAALLGYMIAHVFHQSHKQKVVTCAIAAVLIVLIGGIEYNPNVLEDCRHSDVANSDYFSDVNMTYDANTHQYTVTANVGTGPDGTVPVIAYTGVSMIIFGNIYTEKVTTTSDVAKTPFSGTITFDNWDTSTLHYFTIAFAKANTDGSTTTYTIDNNTATGFTDAKVFNGDSTMMCWGGAAYAMAFFVAIFLFITLCGWFFRVRMKKARSKLEDEGRLYPQGYGRCKVCNAIVLPGEVECRKCGAYIDRPDEMRRKKVDYFKCTNCGCEVSKNSTSCPKCGAVFEDDEEDMEMEVVHSDGTVSTAIECPDCGAAVPEGREGIRICPRCGKRFQL